MHHMQNHSGLPWLSPRGFIDIVHKKFLCTQEIPMEGYLVGQFERQLKIISARGGLANSKKGNPVHNESTFNNIKIIYLATFGRGHSWHLFKNEYRDYHLHCIWIRIIEKEKGKAQLNLNQNCQLNLSLATIYQPCLFVLYS